MSSSPSELRANLYRLLDQVLETGVPPAIERKGRRLQIVVDDPPAKLGRLVPHPGKIRGDTEDSVEMGRSEYWNPDPL